MQKTDKNYILLALLHVGVALAVFVLPVLSKLYSVLVVLFGFYYVLKNKNRNHEVLYVSAYLIGVEVFLRMTGGNFNNEFVKTLVFVLMLLGFVLSGFSKKAWIYWLFLVLLVPGILVTMLSSDPNQDVKKMIVFNISGPLCLGVSAIYCYQRMIRYQQLQNLLVIMGLPILTTLAYLFFYTPSIRDVVTGTQSNFETSGGFGPNQVSTILGLGMFVFFCQLVFLSKTSLMIAVNTFLFAFCSYRALVTFSRGGVITAVAMIGFALLSAYLFANLEGKLKLKRIGLFIGLMAFGVWSYSVFQTGGLLENRYENKDAIGRVKKDRLGGREEIMTNEFDLFKEHPIFGVGVGMGKSFREKMIGQEAASHNEPTRLLAEQGIFGVLCLLLLVLTPFVVYLHDYRNIFFLSFFVFWALTINHAAMRTAAPAFVYALTLLRLDFKKDD